MNKSIVMHVTASSCRNFKFNSFIWIVFTKFDREDRSHTSVLLFHYSKFIKTLGRDIISSTYQHLRKWLKILEESLHDSLNNLFKLLWNNKKWGKESELECDFIMTTRLLYYLLYSFIIWTICNSSNQERERKKVGK